MNKPIKFIAIEIMEEEICGAVSGSMGSPSIVQLHGQFRIGIGRGAVVGSFVSDEFVPEDGKRAEHVTSIVQFAVDQLFLKLSKVNP